MHILLVCLEIAAWVLILIGLVWCFKAPMPRYRWLWVVFVVFGTIQFSLRQTEDFYKVLSVSVAVLRPSLLETEPDTPPEPNVVLPIGALVFLLRRRYLVAAKKA